MQIKICRDGMEYVKLSDVCDVRDGTHDSPKYVANGYPLVTSKNIIDGKLDLSVVNYLSKDDYDKINERSKVDSGDIIMPMIGTIGNPFLVDDFSDFAIKNVALIKFPKKDVINRFVLYFFKSLAFERYIAKNNKGGTQKFLSLGDIRNVPIPKFCFEKQTEIVNNLDKLFTIIGKRKEELFILDTLIKARFVEMFGNLREGECKGIKLGELCNTVSGGTPSTKFAEYYEGDIPWITTTSLGPNHIDGTTAKAFITKKAIDNSATKLIPAGNILFGTRVGVGKSSLNDVDICTNQDIVAIVGIDENRFNKLFIKYVLDFYQPYYNSIKKGATILGITSDDLKNTIVPDVSLCKQNAFETFVEQIDKSKFSGMKGNALFM